ncbi:PEP-CTERM sorting domain-containing protein [Cerasicoccus arenae]|nr:PEP-CTERM sorting domain-containing protein [Cerasicoccus arenae]MBK1857803.1 PEP-CTERM sorting domain-containing protein [Cerasicoccus arenae]
MNKSLLLGCVLIASSLSSQAALILIIDVTDPTAATFTPGPDLPSAASSGWNYTSGFTLLEFFTSAPASPIARDGSGDLTTPNVSPDFSPRGFASASLQSPSGFNIYNYGNRGTVDITTSAPAFSGSMTFDFTPYLASLTFNALGVERGIQGGDFGAIGPVFGNYVIVSSAIPEPSTYIAIAGMFGLAGFIGLRRWKAGKTQLPKVG